MGAEKQQSKVTVGGGDVGTIAVTVRLRLRCFIKSLIFSEVV